MLSRHSNVHSIRLPAHPAHVFSPPTDGASTNDDSTGGATNPGADESLEDAARGEREYTRGRVREELGREPSEEEMDEWLREHTEGY